VGIASAAAGYSRLGIFRKIYSKLNSEVVSQLAENKKSISVLHITFNMGIGGTEQVIAQIILGMEAREVNSEVLCIEGFIGPIGELLQEQGVNLHIVEKQPGFDLSLVKKIRKLVRRGNFDIVHCHQYSPYLYGFLATIGLPVKLVFTEHGRFYPDVYRYKAALINPFMALATPAVVAISESTRKSLARYEFMPQAKIRVIYNGIRGLEVAEQGIRNVKQELGIPLSACVIGTVSRLDPVKNQTMMVRAFRKVLQEFPETYLLLVGDGPDRDVLQQLSISLGIEDRVVFTGFIKKPAAYLASMDIFLLSSHTEGTSMTLLESMSLGIPSVVTNVGGNPEIVSNGESGFLTKPDDENSFAEAIIRLITDIELRDRLGSNSKERFGTLFTSKSMVSQYLDIYQKLCPRG
jgi:glycosyltransferase involved in cell wall biosynthesis